MTEVKRCELNDCHRAAAALCYCCQKSICTRHFCEHSDVLRTQVDSVADAVNVVLENIQTMTVEQLTELPFRKLDQWKCDMHQLIDQTFATKHKQMEELIEKNKEKFREHREQQKNNVMKIQEEVKELVEDGGVTIQQIRLLKNRLTKIKETQTAFEKDFLSVHTQVSGRELVTVSSTLNLSSTFGNSGLDETKQDLLTQSFMHATNPIKSDAASFEAEPIASKFQSSSNPFCVFSASLDESKRQKPIIRGRRSKP